MGTLSGTDVAINASYRAHAQVLKLARERGQLGTYSQHTVIKYEHDSALQSSQQPSAIVERATIKGSDGPSFGMAHTDSTEPTAAPKKAPAPCNSSNDVVRYHVAREATHGEVRTVACTIFSLPVGPFISACGVLLSGSESGRLIGRVGDD